MWRTCFWLTGVIYGNPDLVIGLAQFCIDLEMKPQLLLLGDDNPRYADDPRLKEMVEKVNWKMEVVTNADLWDLDGRLKRKEIELDLILGHSKGRWAAMDNNIPMLRVGFPTYDRAGPETFALSPFTPGPCGWPKIWQTPCSPIWSTRRTRNGFSTYGRGLRILERPAASGGPFYLGRVSCGGIPCIKRPAQLARNKNPQQSPVLYMEAMNLLLLTKGMRHGYHHQF